MSGSFSAHPPKAVREAIARLESAGYQAWCVGGCVRDSLLGKEPTDWDVTTSARPEETAACFAGERLIQVGAAHGTVALVTGEGHPVEITTFRRDGAYTDGRHPDSVGFSRELADDLSRRDFTVNAMAWHPDRGLVDLFHGREDLEAKRLRCVGDPATRFSEDALRILRCLRFSSQLGFAIEPSTGAALWETRELLHHLSQERVREELTKLLTGENASSVLRAYDEVVFTVLPELAPMKGCLQETPFHCYDVWEHTLHALAHGPRLTDLSWAVLLHDSGKPAKKTISPDGRAHFYGHPPESGRIARELLERLRFSKREQEWISALVDHHEDPIPMSAKRLKKLLGQYGEEFVTRLFQLQEADMSAKAPGIFQSRLPDLEQSRALAREILARGECLTLGDLAFSGEDLKAMGMVPGPEMGKLLHQLLEAVLEGRVENDQPELEAMARQLIDRL
ncbi:MAG: CCA tRNA nucleotidyltransferase [Acutalibacter sp.]|jgi:tRNA nucleotidyltransferase (CCA-adding enzyme)